MKRGRKNKPTKLRVIEGNRGHRPINQAEPEFSVALDMPPAPVYLDAYAREEWDRVAPELYGVGLLTIPDQTTLAAYCLAFSRWRFAEEEIQKVAKLDDRTKHGGLVQITKEGNAIQHVLVGIANTARKDMVRIAAEFGLTPSARANLEGSGRGGEDQTEKKFFG